MKRQLHLFCLLTFFLLSSNKSTAQIYGNTFQDEVSYYGPNLIVWIKFTTGASDSGVFTDFGLYDHPTLGGDCDFKFALYSDHATADRPDELLVSEYIASPTNGQFNQYDINPTLAIDASTSYWIGLRFNNCTYGSGRELGVSWAEPPLKFYSSWSFFTAWPDPVNSSSLSTQGFLNNVALYVIGNNAVVPVEMLSFEVSREEKTAILSWATATEINNAGWNIQESHNGFTWNTIDWVDGNGDSHERIAYQYENEITKEGLTFYRLEQVDLDGTKSYSEVKIVDYIYDEVSLFPNPATDKISIRGLNELTEYSLHDAVGTHMITDKMIPQEGLDISNLRTGVYFLTLHGKPYRFIKQ